MLADTDNRPGLDESYGISAGTSNMRVGNDSTVRTPGDLIAAAGMNNHRLGLALTRLASEWASVAKPSLPTQAQIDALARTYRVLEQPHPYAGRVQFERDGKEPEYVLPQRLAKRERGAWYEHEATLVVMNLRSLPTVRNAMLAKAVRSGMEVDAHVVCRVILWWLHPQCPVCGGRKAKVVEGTGRTGGRECRACRGTGLADPPHGRDGERLVGYINGCRAGAVRELREGFQRQRRTLAGESKRQTKGVE